MSAADALNILHGLGEAGVTVVVGGGWGVDALLGEQTRSHADLDLWLSALQFEFLVRAVSAMGLDRLYPWGDDRPWNFVLLDGGRLRVDLHVFEIRADGELHYGSAIDGEVLPSGALDGRGTIGGVEVACESIEASLRFHTGYQPRKVDRQDMSNLCERFGLRLPDELRCS